MLVVNSGIGILQEVRAKRELDRLALLVAPRARVLRDGDGARRSRSTTSSRATRSRCDPGEQVVADGRLLEARGLQLDESVLTGEADPDARRRWARPCSPARSASPAAASTRPRRSAHDAYANELTGVAREDRRELSPLQL